MLESFFVSPSWLFQPHQRMFSSTFLSFFFTDMSTTSDLLHSSPEQTSPSLPSFCHLSKSTFFCRFESTFLLPSFWDWAENVIAIKVLKEKLNNSNTRGRTNVFLLVKEKQLPVKVKMKQTWTVCSHRSTGRTAWRTGLLVSGYHPGSDRTHSWEIWAQRVHRTGESKVCWRVFVL